MTTTLALEINDAGIVLADASGVLAVEPGIAAVERDGIVTGQRAAATARLTPDRIANRYWAELGLEPASGGRAVTATSAELAFAQLDELWRPLRDRIRDVIVVTPGHYTKDQLGVLLGLADECGMPVRAMVDAAVAASTQPFPGRQLVFADAGLHRVSVTPLQQGEGVAADRARSLDVIGLSAYTDALVKRIAELFVSATRFDPLREAATEQELYDRLPAWLAALHTAERIELKLPRGGDEIVVEAERAQLLGAASGFYKALVQLIAQSREAGTPLLVQLTDRLARLPGLELELQRLDAAVVVTLVPGHAAMASLALADRLARGGDVKWLRRVDWRDAPAEQAAADTAAAGTERRTAERTPTHVVYRGVAYRVDGEGLMIGRNRINGRRTLVVDDQSGVSRSHCLVRVSDGEMLLEDLSSHGTFVNERRVSEREILHPADVIRVGSPGAQLQAISMESGSDA